MVKKYVMDESKDWEDRYKELEAHHIEETTDLVKKNERFKEDFDFWRKCFQQFETRVQMHLPTKDTINSTSLHDRINFLERENKKLLARIDRLRVQRDEAEKAYIDLEDEFTEYRAYHEDK